MNDFKHRHSLRRADILSGKFRVENVSAYESVEGYEDLQYLDYIVNFSGCALIRLYYADEASAKCRYNYLGKVVRDNNLPVQVTKRGTSVWFVKVGEEAHG